MYETTLTIVGNLVDDPRVRNTESGIEVTGFRVASTSRRKDRDTNQWVDGQSVFINVSCWRDLGSNVAVSLHKGDPVVVHGRLYTRRYEINGEPRTAFELEAQAVGPDLARGTAQFQRPHRGPAGGPDDADLADFVGSFDERPVLSVVGIGS